eukprot:5789409-Amphidinium_carterae.1
MMKPLMCQECTQVHQGSVIVGASFCFSFLPKVGRSVVIYRLSVHQHRMPQVDTIIVGGMRVK